MAPSSLLHSPVPLVGSPCLVFEAQVIVSVLCNCHDDNVPFLITTIDQAKVCTRCGRAYALTGASFNRAGGDRAVRAEVTVVGSRPTAAPGQN